jgi:hypothetical protein
MRRPDARYGRAGPDLTCTGFMQWQRGKLWMNIFAGNRPFLERGNNSFRFKNSSAYEPEKAKEKNRNFTTASDPKHT